jgi:beta-glucosidase
MSGKCGACKIGQYLCPSDQKTCVNGPEEYSSCPGIKGTHFDSSLDIEARIDYILKNMNVTEQIGQLWNSAPAVDHLGIPEYEWLNDNVHGVGRTSQKATILPNGCGMGATWSRKSLVKAGLVLGQESRALHNFFLHNQSYRGLSPRCNGCGLTIYGPNLNLVKDPRWGRGQVSSR